MPARKATTVAASKAPTRRKPAAPAPKKAAPPRKAAAKKHEAPKQKLVRDSFTIPKSEYEVLDALKQRAASLARPTKKSELLRAGIAALHQLADKAFLDAIEKVPSLKTGRPKQPDGEGKKKPAKKS